MELTVAQAAMQGVKDGTADAMFKAAAKRWSFFR
jgi:hypothetical protein